MARQKKKGKRANPFDEDEAPQFTMAMDAPTYQEAFNNSIIIAGLTKDNLDVKILMKIANAQALEHVINHLEKGTSHTLVRLQDVAEMAPFLAPIKKISKLSENSVEKFKNLMASKMWELGSVNGSFKMDVLVARIRGIQDAK